MILFIEFDLLIRRNMTLPNEIWREVFDKLKPFEILTQRLVNKNWCAVASSALFNLTRQTCELNEELIFSQHNQFENETLVHVMKGKPDLFYDKQIKIYRYLRKYINGHSYVICELNVRSVYSLILHELKAFYLKDGKWNILPYYSEGEYYIKDE